MFINLLKKIKRFILNICNVFIYKFKRFLIRIKSKKYRSLPLENKIVFSNFNGQGYGCNPKYIAEEILKREYGWSLVWLVKDLNADIPCLIKKVKFNSKDSCKELSTAKIIINNVKGDLNFIKKEGQVYIETWHAGFSMKQLEKEAGKTLPWDYILESKYNSKITDYLLSNSVEQTKEYRKNFWYDGSILEFGLPRNDPYFSKNTVEFVNNIKKELNIFEEQFVIMYAPTFRSHKDTFEVYGLDFDRLIKNLERKLGQNFKLLIRTHPNVTGVNNISADNDKILNVSDYPDMQELLIISDLLITDYSSTMFEFSLLQKPTILFAIDANKYDKKIRGLKEVFWQGLFPLAQSNDELEKIINNFDYGKSVDNVLDIRNKYCTFDNGDASQKVVNFLAQILQNGK